MDFSDARFICRGRRARWPLQFSLLNFNMTGVYKAKASSWKTYGLKAGFGAILLVSAFMCVMLGAEMFEASTLLANQNTEVYFDLYDGIPDYDESPNTPVESNIELLNVTVTSDVYSSSKVTHVGFLKVHKAGSTTMQNLFFRFGIKHKLNVVIPKSGNYLLNRSKAIQPKYSDHYDIFACHTVYSNAWFSTLLPKDAMRIAIIREPLDRMISAAYYYRDVYGFGYLKNVPKANFIHNIVQKPETYDRAFFSKTKNSMGKDFGFSMNTAKDNTTIRNYLQQLDNEFSLVMLTEHMDESLVMMRRLLNWSISDIIYLSTNIHKHNPTLLKQSELNQFKKTNFLDYAIYEYFSDVFVEKMKALGQDLNEEVSFFKKCLTGVHEFCQQKENINVTHVEFENSKWDPSFRISRTDCDWMNTKELALIGKLRKMYTT